MNTIATIKSVFSVLFAGKELSNAAAWKNTQAIMALLTAAAGLAAATGHPIPINNDVLGNIAIGASGLASAYLTYATSAKVGLPASEPTMSQLAHQAELPPLHPSTRSDLPDLT